ncbi:MAG: septum formation inhibitor Maf [Alphaproteobacteria bacterium HGW-Alphaproteobacteria-2]|nr:MAG: septum formation inhibitor Maf [Alphaproteobacteria bacterium HGW-Alphaproteobacteria-2]
MPYILHSSGRPVRSGTKALLARPVRDPLVVRRRSAASFHRQPRSCRQFSTGFPHVRSHTSRLDIFRAAAASGSSEAKALKLSLRRPGRLVLGGDQTLECDGAIFSKPADMAEAARQLEALQGRSHLLHSAAVLAEDGSAVWRHVSTARLTMRRLDQAAIEEHLSRAGGAILGSVGAYHVEGPGLRLFTAIDGDFFTVMGLPLLPLLNHLIDRGLLAP